MLLQNSFEVANDHFPLGSGFGTYGSNSSGIEYSPLYQKYGLNNIYGLTQSNPMFISDSFWPMILGQFGYFGLFIYLIIILNLFRIIQQNFNSAKVHQYIVGLGIFIYLIISSIAESAFVNPIAMPFAILLGIFSSCAHGKKEINSEKIQESQS
jgi:hypothetical protein